MKVSIDIDETQIIKMAMDGTSTPEIQQEFSRRLIEKAVDKIDRKIIWSPSNKVIKAAEKQIKKAAESELLEKIKMRVFENFEDDLTQVFWNWMEGYIEENFKVVIHAQGPFDKKSKKVG